MEQKIEIICNKIRVDEGDTVIAHVKNKNVTAAEARAVNQELKRAFPDNRIVSLFGEDVDVEAVERKISDGDGFGGKEKTYGQA